MDGHITLPEHSQRLRSKRGPGKGLLEWIKLCRRSKQHMNRAEQITVTFEELRRHNKEDDCWTAFRGDVYDITQYLSFHPGGQNELMKAAGIDCTSLFTQIHSHVNLPSILITVKVGTLDISAPLSSLLPLSQPLLLNADGFPQGTRKGMNKIALDNVNHEDVADGVYMVNTSPVSTEMNKGPSTPTTVLTLPSFTDEQSISNAIAIPETRSRRCARDQRDQPSVKYIWNQTETDIVLKFTLVTVQHLEFSVEDVTMIIKNHEFEAKIVLGNWCYKMRIALENPVSNSEVLLVGSQLQIRLEKVTSGKLWSNLGVQLPGNSEITLLSSDILDMQYMSCSLKEVQNVNDNTKIFIFKLPGASYMMVPTGHHVSIQAKNPQGELIERNYTPVLPLVGSCHSEGSELNLMVKLYNNGAMSSILSSLNIGDTMDISLPLGNFTISQLDKADHIVLIAAGSGFTPMVKIIRNICIKNCESEIEKTTIKLLFFNQTMKDILLLDKLQSLSEKDPNFTVVHILSQPGSGWTGARGRISRQLLQNHMPLPNDNQLICVCGPTQFTQLALSTLLDMEFSENCIHAFE